MSPSNERGRASTHGGRVGLEGKCGENVGDSVATDEGGGCGGRVAEWRVVAIYTIAGII